MAEDKKSVRVTYTKELESILRQLEYDDSYVAFELLCLGEESSQYDNGLRIGKVDVSKNKNSKNNCNWKIVKSLFTLIIRGDF